MGRVFIFLSVFLLGTYSLEANCITKVGALSDAKIAESRTIAIIGAAGSLKGTVARLIKEKITVIPFSVGEALRLEVNRGSEAGLKAKPFMETHRNSPNEVVAEVVQSFLKSVPNDVALLLDGAPRNQSQLNQLRADLAKINRKIDIVFELGIDLETSKDRINGRLLCPKCQTTFHTRYFVPKVLDTCDHCESKLTKRSDDSVEGAEKRWKVYQDETIPALDQLRTEGIVYSLDGNQPARVLVSRILDILQLKR
ncbi:MAG: adenylate kinase [Bacteriovoracaceae bacterium]|nr:adenylate kinase [Bacteriovoracaceae bacterium]